MKPELDRAKIIQALQRLSELLGGKDIRGEICLLGGAVMVVAFHARAATKDVDAIFHPTGIIREIARVVQEELDLPENWLNEGAKGFISAAHETTMQDLPQFENLHVAAPTAEYLLAMKCLASRIAASPDEKGDGADIEFLVRHLKLKNAAEAMAIVGRYYPEPQIPPRAQFLLEEVFEQLRKDK
jgi:hypothetical protein